MKKRISQAVLMLILLPLIQGCLFIAESLDYRRDLSDYEVKRIVRRVLLSQHVIADAALATTDGYTQLYGAYTSYDTTRYSCRDGGYLRLEIGEGDYTFSFESGDLLHLTYDNCRCDACESEFDRLSGPVDIVWYQDSEDALQRVIELGITYHYADLYAPFTSVRLDGRIGLHYDRDYRRGILRLILSTNDLSLHGSDFGDDTRYENVVLDFTMDEASHAWRYSYSGTLFSSYLGRLTFTTLTPLEGYDAHNPDRGEFKITNAHMSLRVVPRGNGAVDIYVENHFDITQNRTIRTSWRDIGL